MDYTILVTSTILGIIGGIVAIIFVKSRQLDPSIVTKRLRLNAQYTKELEDEIDYYAKELRSYKGKLASQKGSVGLSDSISLDSADGVGVAIKELLPQIAPFLPKQAQAFLQDPKLVDMGIELYKKDPDKAKSILTAFVKKGAKGKSSTQASQGVQQNEIPEFGSGGVL